LFLAGDPEVFWERTPSTPQAGRVLEVRENREGHALDRALGWAAMAPLVACAMAAWLTAGSFREVAMSLAIIWGGAILAFLAGVRRGLSFRPPGGAQGARLLFTLWTFVLAFGSMIALRPLTSLGLLILGYAGLALAGRGAALREEVPLFFAGSGPAQVSVAALSLCAVAARLMISS
jgi:hypothetical protein